MHRAKVRKYEKLDIPDKKERMDGVPRKRLEYKQEEEENPRICSYTVGFNASDPLLKQATTYLFFFTMRVFWPLVFSYFRFYVAEWLLASLVIINKCKRVLYINITFNLNVSCTIFAAVCEIQY